MIKRRFYRFEHGNRDDPSGSDSSSSESEVEVEPAEDTDFEEEEEEEDVDDEVKEGENVASEKGGASSSSGYESEDSSVNEVNLDSSGLPTSDDDVVAQNIIGSFSGVEGNSLPTSIQHSPKKDETDLKMADCVLKCKSVFKCKLCPRIVCLSEETLKAHLSSKKHARSEKLLKEGRLKLMLNDDGEIEGEVQSENHGTTTVSEQTPAKPKQKGKGRSKQKKRPRQDTESRKEKPSTENRAMRRKRRKNDD